MKKIKETRNRDEIGKMIDNMPSFNLARWQALMDAVELVAEKAEDRKIKFETLDIKPLAVERFIEATCDNYCRKIDDLRKEEKLKEKTRADTLLPNLIGAINNSVHEPTIRE